MLNPFIGLGLRQPHYEDFLELKPKIGWVEVHSENYLCCGGSSFDYLLKIRRNYPVSLHGIGMSLGSADGLDLEHLKQVKNLIEIIDPCFISDHLSWSSKDGYFLPELLPTPYNKECLAVFSKNISMAQDFLGREIMVENPSTYLEYTNSTYAEPEFLNLLAEKTGAGILLDVNNIYVSAQNHNWSALEYLNSIEARHVNEIHLAGHSEKLFPNNTKLLIDTHDNVVCPEVWDLYKKTISLFGPIPTLIEWDANIPDLAALIAEAIKTNIILEEYSKGPERVNHSISSTKLPLSTS